MLHVYASLEEQALNEDEVYRCPLFVPGNSIMPNSVLRTTIAPSLLKTFSPHPTKMEHAPLCYVPINTTEDYEDCIKHRVALCSSPQWIVPA